MPETLARVLVLGQPFERVTGGGITLSRLGAYDLVRRMRSSAALLEWIADCAPDAEALRRALTALAGDPGRRAVMDERGRHLAETEHDALSVRAAFATELQRAAEAGTLLRQVRSR